MSTTYLIDKEFLLNNQISDEALMVLIGIRTKFTKPVDLYVSYALLEGVIYGYKNTDRSKREAIIAGFNELVSEGLIKIICTMKNDVMVCDISKVCELIPSHYYINISKDEFQKIINLKEGVYNYKLLRYFVDLIGTFDGSKTMHPDYRFKIGHMSQSVLCSICRVNSNTLNKYNDILERNQLIYIARRKSSVVGVKSGSIYKQMPNVYSRYEHKEECDKYIKENGFKQKGDKFINTTNEMRSLSQKYNYFKRTYADKMCEDLDKVQAAYAAAKLWNRYAKEDYNAKVEAGESPVEPKYKDLSIFEKYGLTD